MTEYDWSAQAAAQHREKLGRIEHWRHEAQQYPSYDPRAGDPELTPYDSLSQAGEYSSWNGTHPQLQPMGYSYPQIYQPAPTYIQPQVHYPQFAQPVYYPAAENASYMTYSHGQALRYTHTRKSSRHYGHHHTSGTRSHHASPSTASIPLHGLAAQYIPTVSLEPQAMERSYSSPPRSQSSYFTANCDRYPIQQSLMEPIASTYPLSPPATTTYPYASPDGTLSPYAQTVYTHRSSVHSPSRPHRSSHSVSHDRPRSASHLPAMSGSVTYIQVNAAPQPTVIPYGNGGQIILPPNGSTYVVRR